MASTKITAKLYAPMYADFDKQLSDALLRRDAFLNRMIAAEIPSLRKNLSGKRLSPAAHRYISQSLKAMGGKHAPPLRQVSIAVTYETAQALNEAVAEHNLVRDSFLNWLIALLRSSDKLLERLGLPTRVTSDRRDGTEDMPTSPIKAIQEIEFSPLYYLHSACERQWGCGLYDLRLPKELHGLACYLPDEDVPGTLPNKKKQEEDEEFLRTSLDIFESSITAGKNTTLSHGGQP